MDAHPVHWLVVGYGNELRGDDGAGPVAARRIQDLGLTGVEVLVGHQLLPEHSARLADVDAVVFVDALADPGAGLVCQPVVADDGGGWTGHLGTPASLLALTRLLVGRCPKGWVLGVPVERFGWEIGLSARARAGVDEAVDRVRELIE